MAVQIAENLRYYMFCKTGKIRRFVRTPVFLSLHQNAGQEFYSQITQKMLKIKISTSVLGVQHTKAGQNIQQESM